MQTNANRYCFCFTSDDLPPQDKARMGQQKGAVLKEARWDVGALISIRFLEGDPGLKDRVQAVAEEWMKVANLNFNFVNDGPTDIRIAFKQGNGSWSYIGTMCRSIPESDPTMNYGWLTPESDDDELRRVVLHEFGHAIGLIHEHQNPQGGIKWNKVAVENDLSGPPNYWDSPTIENNMFHHYPPDDVIATNVDPESIMMYPIPKAWTLDGFSAGLNGALSETDKVLIKSSYPR